MSENVYKALFSLKKFNYENIYKYSLTSSEKEYYTKGMNILFSNYLEAIINQDKNNIIYKVFLNNQNEKYLANTSSKRMVIDFISGMTDDMFINEIKRIELLKNE